MYSKDQLINGLVSYMDHEVMPHIPTSAKWVLGTYIVTMRVDDDKFKELVHHPLLEPLHIEKDGLYDVDELLENLYESAQKYGKIEIKFPMLEPMAFNHEDVKALHKHIKETR